MNRPLVWTFVACLFPASPAPAGEVVPQGKEFVVGTFEFGGSGAASAMSPDGSFALAGNAGFCCIFARGLDGAGNGVGIPWDLIHPTFSVTSDPIDVTALADDDFVVVWESYNAVSEPVIYTRRFALDGTPLGAGLEVSNGGDGSKDIHPTVDAWHAASDFLVAWAQANDPGDPGADGLDIQLAAFSVLSARQGDFMVNTYVTGDQDHPELSVGIDSSFLVVWRSTGSPGSDSDGLSVQGTWFSPGGSPESQFQVNTYTTGDQDHADVAMAPDGRFLVVWDGLSAGSDVDRGIQGRLFGPDQVPLGPDFQVNTSTTDIQSKPAVESRADGSFLVVWRSPSGLFGQVIGPDGSLIGSEQQLNSNEAELYTTPVLSGALNGRFVVTWDTEYGNLGNTRWARLLRDSLFSDDFESGDTSAWSVVVP